MVQLSAVAMLVKRVKGEVCNITG